MPHSLLDQFLAEECTPHVRRVLLDAIADSTIVRPRFEFNRFEVALDRASGIAALRDDLDATIAGVQTIPLAVFMNALVGARPDPATAEEAVNLISCIRADERLTGELFETATDQL